MIIHCLLQRLYINGVNMKKCFFKEYILTEIEDIKIAVDGVLGELDRVYKLGEARKYEIRLVMNELLVNCFDHAQTGGKQMVVLKVSVMDGHLSIRIKDNGEGFAYDATPHNLNRVVDEDLLYNERGRGLMLVRAFCQDIEYFGNGNSVEVKIGL